MTTTAQQLIDRVRREVVGSRVEPLNKLTADIDSSVTTVTFTNDLNGISEGTRFSIGLEDFYVWSTNPTAKSATVQRAYESTASVHTAGDLVQVTPRISNVQILNAINDWSANAYGEGLYRMATSELTFNPSTSTYELPVGTLDVYRVQRRVPGYTDWPRVYGYMVDRNQNATDFPTSGIALNFMWSDTPTAGFDFLVTYRAGYGQLAALTDVVESVVGTPAIDLIKLGAAMKLTRNRETTRNLSETQGQTRRANEVPPGAEMGASREMQRLYQQEKFRELGRLARLYPPESMR